MKVGSIAALLCAACSAVPSYAENEVRLAATQNQFRVTTEQAAEDGGRRAQEIWAKTATQPRGNFVGIAAISAQEERYVSGCSR
jgi:hypothetical protein